MDLQTLDFDPERDLMLERVLPVSPERVWACWTEPRHLERWFTPAPWTTSDVVMELRPGGLFQSRMTGPDGEPLLNIGCVLEVVPLRRLVWTDGMWPGFRPKTTGFLTAFILLEPHPEGTRYIAIARHVDAKGRNEHAAMGFHDGWGVATDQLVALAKTL